MELVYSFNILESEVDENNIQFPDTIKRIKFALIGTDETATERVENTFRRDDVYLPLPASEGFLPFDQLSKEDYINFIISVYGEAKINALKADMVLEIQDRYARYAAQTVNKLPWVEPIPLIDPSVVIDPVGPVLPTLTL